MAKTGQAVLPVRIDDDRLGQVGRREMMIDNDGIEPEPLRFGERLVRTRPAIDADEKRRAAG